MTFVYRKGAISSPISAAATLCVSAPMEAKSTPASAYSRTFASVIPPVASISIPGTSSRARRAHARTVGGG